MTRLRTPPRPAAEPFAPDPKLFVRNMAALWRNDAELAQRIDDLPVDARVPIEIARNGSPTVTIATEDGRRLSLHSRYDPEQEARRLVDGLDLEDTFCFAIGGFGLGYHVRELFRRLRGDAFIIVAERDLVLLKTALEALDLADLLASTRCVILTHDNPAELHSKLGSHNITMMLGAKFVGHPPSEQAAGPFHASMRRHLTDYFSYCRMSIVTLAANSRISCRNVANNFATYVSTPGIGELAGRFAGYPAIIVSAGPSARKNLEQLHHARPHSVVIAVQTMFKPLLAMGIQPDFVTSLDYHEISRKFFEGVEDVGNSCLVAEPKASWHTVDAFRGPIRLLDNLFARLCLGDELGGRAGLKAGATVAHLAFYLAEHLGCNPIIFIGQDLGFSGGVYYSPGVPVHDTWRPELNRFHTLEMMEWERIVRARKILRPIADVHGHRIYTDDQMFTYLQQFESDFAASRSHVVDATEGGARKFGTEVMTFSEAIERWCTRTIPEESRRITNTVDAHAKARQRAASDAVAQRLGEIDAFTSLCAEILSILDTLGTLVDRPAAFNRELARIDALRTQVRRHDRICQMVSAISQMAELRRYSADRRIDADDDDARCRARRQLKRDVDFISALKDGADDLRTLLEESLARLETAGT